MARCVFLGLALLRKSLDCLRAKPTANRRRGGDYIEMRRMSRMIEELYFGSS